MSAAVFEGGGAMNHVYDGFLFVQSAVDDDWTERFCTLEAGPQPGFGRLRVFTNFTAEVPIRQVDLDDRASCDLVIDAGGKMCIEVRYAGRNGHRDGDNDDDAAVHLFTARCSSTPVLRQWFGKIGDVLQHWNDVAAAETVAVDRPSSPVDDARGGLDDGFYESTQHPPSEQQSDAMVHPVSSFRGIAAPKRHAVPRRRGRRLSDAGNLSSNQPSLRANVPARTLPRATSRRRLGRSRNRNRNRSRNRELSHSPTNDVDTRASPDTANRSQPRRRNASNSKNNSGGNGNGTSRNKTRSSNRSSNNNSYSSSGESRSSSSGSGSSSRSRTGSTFSSSGSSSSSSGSRSSSSSSSSSNSSSISTAYKRRSHKKRRQKDSRRSGKHHAARPSRAAIEYSPHASRSPMAGTSLSPVSTGAPIVAYGEPTHKVVFDFEAEAPEEMSCRRGDLLQVLPADTDDDAAAEGWLLAVRYQPGSPSAQSSPYGYVPADYLVPLGITEGGAIDSRATSPAQFAATAQPHHYNTTAPLPQTYLPQQQLPYFANPVQPPQRSQYSASPPPFEPFAPHGQQPLPPHHHVQPTHFYNPVEQQHHQVKMQPPPPPPRSGVYTHGVGSAFEQQTHPHPQQQQLQQQQQQRRQHQVDLQQHQPQPPSVQHLDAAREVDGRPATSPVEALLRHGSASHRDDVEVRAVVDADDDLQREERAQSKHRPLLHVPPPPIYSSKCPPASVHFRFVDDNVDARSDVVLVLHGACCCFYIRVPFRCRRFHYFNQFHAELQGQMDEQSFATFGAVAGSGAHNAESPAAAIPFKYVKRASNTPYERMERSCADSNIATAVPLGTLTARQLMWALQRAELSSVAKVLAHNDVSGADVASFEASDLDEFGPEFKSFQRQKLLNWIADCRARGVPQGALAPPESKQVHDALHQQLESIEEVTTKMRRHRSKKKSNKRHHQKKRSGDFKVCQRCHHAAALMRHHSRRQRWHRDCSRVRVVLSRGCAFKRRNSK